MLIIKFVYILKWFSIEVSRTIYFCSKLGMGESFGEPNIGRLGTNIGLEGKKAKKTNNFSNGGGGLISTEPTGQGICLQAPMYINGHRGRTYQSQLSRVAIPNPAGPAEVSPPVDFCPKLVLRRQFPLYFVAKVAA